VLRHEWRLSKQKRQQHLDYIKLKCSPKILKNNLVSVIIEASSRKMSNSQLENLNERFQVLQLKLEKEVLSWKKDLDLNETKVEALSDSGQNERVITSLKSDIGQLKNDISEIKSLLKAKLK
jgi:hypothetical protein